MKKLFAGLVATIMMIGLVSGLTGGSAVAVPGPYQNTVPTNVNIKVADTVERGHAVRIGVRVTAAGNGSPRNGHVTIRVARVNGGYRYLNTKSYDGGTVYFTTDQLNRVGKYRVAAKYDRASESKYMDGNNVATFKVVR